MGMQVQKSKILSFTMKMGDDLFYGINWGVQLGRRVDIAAVQVDSIGVNSIVTSCHSVGIDDRKYIENKFVSKKSGLLAILSDFTDDASHDMRTWHLPWMHSGGYDEAFLFWPKLFGFVMIDKKILILQFFILG